MFSVRKIVYNTLARNWRLCSNIASTINIDMSDPIVERYLEHLKNDWYTFKTKGFYDNSLLQMLYKRDKILDDYKMLDELQKHDTKNDMSELVKLERESFKNQLTKINDNILNALFADRVLFNESECIIEIVAGVGGKEAMLFANELLKMYCGYATYKNWDFDVINEGQTDFGGSRHASLLIKGIGAYDILRNEGGVHRVQRVPATEKSGRLHTSTVQIAVMMQPSEIEIVLHDRDITIATKRSTGAGGQNVNKTESCVRITHLPTGITVECQEERQQHINKRVAFAKLRMLLYEKKLEEMSEKDKKERKMQMGAGMRNEKIRTFNFNQDRVTDHRLGSANGTVHNIVNVLMGGQTLDNLINRIVQMEHKNKILAEIESFRMAHTKANVNK